MKKTFWRPTSAVLLVMFAAGCQHSPGQAEKNRAIVDGSAALDDELARAKQAKLPAALLVVDPDRSQADRVSRGAFHSAIGARADVVPVMLELSTSRNRAAAAPFHALDQPTLMCLSPSGIIVSRDEGTITTDLARRRIDLAKSTSPEADREFTELQEAVITSPNDINRRMALADFLLSHHNDREAAPHLKFVADNPSAEISVRVRAWVALGRAHLWIVEPEKARHAAQDLIATLGPKSPDAIAGGNLVRGLQDTRAKRYDRARDELKAAVAASPDSPYGRDAADLLSKLPGN